MGPSLSSISGTETVIVFVETLELICFNIMSALKEGAIKNHAIKYIHSAC